MCKRQSTFLPLYFCLFYNETAAAGKAAQNRSKFCLCLPFCSGFSVKFCNSITKKLFQNQFGIIQQLFHYIVEKRFNCIFPVFCNGSHLLVGVF